MSPGLRLPGHENEVSSSEREKRLKDGRDELRAHIPTGGPNLGDFIRLSLLDFVNCLKIVQNIKIKMIYLIVVVLLCVLDVSGGVSSDF